jgi:hypothetical protein
VESATGTFEGSCPAFLTKKEFPHFFEKELKLILKTITDGNE